MQTTERILDELMALLPGGVQILDEHGQTIGVNEAFLHLFGFRTPEQVVGHFNPLDDRTVAEHGLTEYVRRAYKGEVVETPAATFRSPLGPSRTVRARLAPVCDESNVVRQVVVTFEDLTDQEASTRIQERRYRQIAALQASFRRVNGNLSTEGVLQSVLEAMGELKSADACAIWRVNTETDAWTCLASQGLSDEYRQDVETLYNVVGMREKMLGSVIRENRPIAIENTEAGVINESLRELLRREKVGRLLAVPMCSGEAVTGSLSFYGREPRPFDPLDIEMACLLADQAAIALHNADLYGRARSAAAEAQALNQIATLLTQTSGLSEVLRAITETIAPLMGLRRVAINTVDLANDESRLMAATGVSAEEMAQWGVGQPRRISEQHPLLRRMYETGEPMVLNEISPDLLADLGDEQRAAVEGLGLRSILVVPMFDDGRAVGSITFDEPGERRMWTDRDLRLARALAAQAAVAIRNARLADEARTTREWLEERIQERTEDLRAAHAEVIASEKLAAVGFMAREVAHGLRNPLNVISTSLYYLKSRFPEPDDKVERHFETIARSVQQAANTITQLMNLAGSRQPEMAPVDLNQLAQRALQDRFTAEDFHWVAQWDANLPYVHGDWTQINHAMKAMLGYAASSGGIIHIRTAREGNRAVFAVGDGRHLTDQDREALFQPFFASATAWTGLGLSVARQIAVKHDGDLNLEESDGLTWVRLSLPLAESDTPANPPEPGA